MRRAEVLLSEAMFRTERTPGERRSRELLMPRWRGARNPQSVPAESAATPR